MKVEFKDDDARRLWNDLVRLAWHGMNSKDENLRRAGEHLNTMMQDLVSAEGTVTFEVRERPFLKNYFSGGAVTWDQISGARVEMDRDYTEQKYGMSNVLTFAHEAGHAWAILTGKRRQLNPAALDAENAGRTIMGGCEMRRDHGTPPECQ